MEPIDILLVEDDPRDAELTLRALNKAKITNHVHWVKDGAKAIELLLGERDAPASDAMTGHPKFILLDLKLPKVSGIEVLRKLKGDPRTRRIPVVALTSSKEERDVLETYDLGVNSYVVKPLDFAKFTKAVADVGLYWVVLNRPPEG